MKISFIFSSNFNNWMSASQCWNIGIMFKVEMSDVRLIELYGIANSWQHIHTWETVWGFWSLFSGAWHRVSRYAAARYSVVLGCCNSRHIGLSYPVPGLSGLKCQSLSWLTLISGRLILYSTCSIKQLGPIMTLLPSTCHTRNNHQQALRTILMNSSCTKTPLQRHSTSWDCVRQESWIVNILKSIVINHNWLPGLLKI